MKEPKNSCPDINKIISFVRDAQKSASLGKENNDLEYFDIILNELSEVEDLMEEVRGINDSLRDWGSSKCDEIKDLEDNIYYLEKDIQGLNYQISDLEEEIKDYKYDIANLETKVEDLDNQIYDLDIEYKQYKENL